MTNEDGSPIEMVKVPEETVASVAEATSDMILEFRDGLSAKINARAGEKQFSLPTGGLDSLFELLLNLFDGCSGILSPAGVASSVASPTIFLKWRLRKRVKAGIFKGRDRDYDSQGGQDMADSVLEQTAEMGEAKCAKLVTQMRSGPNTYPFDDVYTA